MSKIEKKIKSYFEDSLKFDDQYENIVRKANLQKKEKKESFIFMKKSNVLKFAIPCFLLVIALVVGIVLLGGGNNPPLGKEEGAVVQMNVNPSVSFVVSEEGTVISVYGENDEGKMLVNGEVFVDLTLEEAIEKILELEKETGYLVSGNVSEEENKISFTIEADKEAVMKSLNDKVTATVNTVCEELNIKENLEVVKNNAKDSLVARALELDPTLTEEAAKAMESHELLKYISACQLEKVSIPTEQLEELYNNYKNQQVVLVEREETKAVIDQLDSTYQTLKDSYDEMYNVLVQAQTLVNDAYAEWFLKEGSVYQESLKAYQEAKAKVIVLENEIAQMQENDLMKPFKEMELTGYKQALSLCEQALPAAKQAADEIVKGLNQAIESALANMDEFYANLPEEVKTQVTNSLQDLETKINTAKDNAFNEFETKYKAELEAAIEQASTYKQNLIGSLKGESQ